ncbi:MAG: 5'-deoxynucleotidase [Firmicutes bacterium]|nr:5'-deoxynucleotidase [Bacillota bacterium]
MSIFFAYLSRMKYINRWNTMRNTKEENIQEHSLQVAMLAHAIALIKNRYFQGEVDPERAAILAIYHEVSEVITGDMATPIKYYNEEIRQAYVKLEEMASLRLYEMVPEELKDDYYSLLFNDIQDQEEWKIVKYADKITAYLKCVEELKAGNKEFSMAKESIYEDLLAIEAEEVKFFLDNFLEGFSMTLDELNKRENGDE